jgi:uncharacterized membrane protein YeaQ/YmgE (transglycosylase-associated protein family)
MFWFILVLLVFGLVFGFIARAAVPGDDNMSLAQTWLLGVGGSLLGGFLGAVLFGFDSDDGVLQAGGLIGSIVGSILLLLVVRLVRRRRTADALRWLATTFRRPPIIALTAAARWASTSSDEESNSRRSHPRTGEAVSLGLLGDAERIGGAGSRRLELAHTAGEAGHVLNVVAVLVNRCSFRQQVLYGVVLIIVGVFVGPGSVSIFT